MSTEDQPASPLPWKVVEHGPNDHRVVNANAREVIKSYGSCYVYPADAHYIVRAVNAHDELLAACKALLAKLEDVEIAIGVPCKDHGDSSVCTLCGGAGWGPSDINHGAGCPVLVAERGEIEAAAEAAVAKAEGREG